ncbi:cation-binding protein [Burkholderia sp. SG-MS1]|uniref:hemerythrin domain-containing protein n=1 Tax=Paraburkholderia sp. SG-MS1 TaxID=2023741 RepID=UPI00144681A2|nr:hemerythrin domain-containing protein [Paraburkholderia sp. SG-MS1]NKJ47431.1 cation-binding protein [Paraburkholderia sp. SG-MS1]
MPERHSSMSPTVTSMIRLDHMHVLAAFHRYHADSSWWRKRAIVNSTCDALEIHAQLEEEIFYPALATALPDDPTLVKSRPEHDEMRATIARLRGMGPENAAYDGLFQQLMREVIHHVADEETILLPAAERALATELRSLGTTMTQRRLQLLKERPAEIAVNTAGTFPVATFLLGSALVLAVRYCLPKSHRRQWDHSRDD